MTDAQIRAAHREWRLLRVIIRWQVEAGHPTEEAKRRLREQFGESMAERAYYAMRREAR